MNISARIHDSDETPTVIPMFSGSGYMTRLERRLPDLWISCELRMSSVNRKLLSAILDFRHTQTSDSIPTSLVVSLDPENMGIAVGISLLSCIEADISVVLYSLPVYGRHIEFLTSAFTTHY